MLAVVVLNAYRFGAFVDVKCNNR